MKMPMNQSELMDYIRTQLSSLRSEIEGMAVHSRKAIQIAREAITQRDAVLEDIRIIVNTEDSHTLREELKKVLAKHTEVSDEQVDKN